MLKLLLPLTAPFGDIQLLSVVRRLHIGLGAYVYLITATIRPATRLAESPRTSGRRAG
jgi:hypothetical protein